MVTVAVLTGKDVDRRPESQHPIGLLACDEDYGNVQMAFKFLKEEIDAIKSEGFPYVHFVA